MLTALLACALSTGADPAGAAFIPDGSFGSGGFARLALGVADDELVDSLVQPDGKIVSCGSADLLPNPAVVVTRVNPDGSPDDSFSGDGRTYLAFGGNSGVCSGVEIDSAGRLYVGSQGSLAGVAQVARLDTAGALTSGYGTGGYGTFDNAGVFVNAIDLGPGDKIVGAGFDGGQFVSDLYVGRLTAGGVPDSVFNATGSRTVSYEAGNVNRADAVSVGADNKVTVAGRVTRDVPSTDVPYFVIGRFTNTGGLDAGFGTSTGRTVFRVGIFNDMLQALHVLPDGSVIAAGTSFLATGGGGTSGVVVRVDDAGAQDLTFGTGGFTSVSNEGGQGLLTGLTMDAKGRLVASGYRLGGPAQLFRFSTSGVADATFSPAGVLNLTSNLTSDFTNAVTTDGAGRLIATGGADNGEDDDSMLFAVKAAPDPPAGPAGPGPEPLAKITSPKGGSSSKLTKISGTASGGTISRVKLAIERVDSKLLKKKKRCVFVKSTKRTTKRVKVKTTKTCGVGVTINAKGTSSWSLKFSKSLPAGQYRITAIALASSGAKTATFSRSRGNQLLVRVKPKKR